MQLHLKLFIFTQSKREEWRKWCKVPEQRVILITHFNITITFNLHVNTCTQRIRESDKCMYIFSFSQIDYTFDYIYQYKW